MQFVHDDISLNISEAREDQKVAIFMQDDDNPAYGHWMELEVEQLVLLRDWLTKQIERLE